MRYIDKLLNSITMYRIVLYGLSFLVLVAIMLGYLHIVSFSGTALVISVITIIFSCFISNTILAKIFNIPPNIESVYISAYILFFVFLPATNFNNGLILIAASILAMGSKYIFTIKRKHIFNPVAISALILSLLGAGSAIWWIATPAMLIPVTMVGLLIVRKIRRFNMLLPFLVTSFLVLIIVTLSGGSLLIQTLKLAFLSGPMIFFGTIMLTEPLTAPHTKKLQIVYGIIIGIIYSSQFSFWIFSATPQMALVIGNIFAFIITPNIKPILEFISDNKITNFIHNLSFKSDQKFNFKPGQYLEWTVPHDKSDTRGIRRFFTIASSPTEEFVQLGVRVQDNGSSFKKKLVELKPGDKIIASNIGGEFTLPRNKSKKLLFIAGGIGITPFRSMIKYLIDTKQKRDVILIYAASTVNDFAFKEVFAQAEKDFGLKIFYLTTFITEELIDRDVPDIKERTIYLSGPDAMVNNYVSLMKKIAVPNSQIKTDYFPGF